MAPRPPPPLWTAALVLALVSYAVDVAALFAIAVLAGLGRLTAGEALSGFGVILAARLYPGGPGGRGGSAGSSGASVPATPPSSLLTILGTLRRAALRLVELAGRAGRALRPSASPSASPSRG